VTQVQAIEQAQQPPKTPASKKFGQTESEKHSLYDPQDLSNEERKVNQP
jgi:hypothetical protein